MPIISEPRNRPRRPADYKPDTIGSWVAVTERDSPWNTIGTALMGTTPGKSVDHLMTAAEALKESGLDITVRKVQVNDSETGKPIPTAFHTFYEDMSGPTKDWPDRHYFGPVSDVYEVVQPAAALSWLDEVVANHDGAHYSAVWSMLEKAQMGLTIEFPETVVIDPEGANDVLGLYGLGYNSFDASTSLGLGTVLERFWCTNQLPPTLHVKNGGNGVVKRSYCTKHTSKVGARTANARAAVGMVLNYAREFDIMATKLFHASFSDNQLIRLANTFDQFKMDGSESGVVKVRKEERREELMAAWRASHNANITGTKWGAFNVMAEWADWGRNVNGSRRNGTDPVRQRAIGTLVNFPTTMKTRCLERLAA